MIEQAQDRDQTSQQQKPRVRHLRLKAALAVAFLFVVVGLAWYLTSPTFREHMRKALIAKLEHVTGGRVELRSLRWNLSRLEIEVDDLTIHGLEPANETPYAHADRIYARLKILSFVGREFGLRELAIDHPVVHLIVNADGTTNQPRPKVARSGKSGAEQLFDLAVERAEARNGWLLYNDTRTPIDLKANDVSFGMAYRAAEQRFETKFRVGKTDVKLESMRPFAVEAQAEFSIFKDRVQLDSLRVRGGGARLEAHGSISELSQPKVDLAYKLGIDLGEAGRVTRVRELRGGLLEAVGSGRFGSQGFNTSGKLTLKNGAYADSAITLKNVAGGLEYSADPDRVVIPHIFAQLLGGTVKGDARLLNWRSTKQVGQQGKVTEQEGRVSLDVHGASLNELMAAISNPQYLPLDTLNAVGAVDGKVTSTWRGRPSAAVTAVSFESVPPITTRPGELPVTARASAVYKTSTLQISNLDVETPASRVSASGTLGRDTEKVKVTANTSNLGEVMPLIDALRPAGPMPVQFNGAANFTGTAYGRLSWPTFAGHFEARDFGTLIPGPSNSEQPDAANRDVVVLWDNVAGDIIYDSTHAVIRNGVLRRRDSVLRLDADTQLKRGKLSPEYPLAVHAAMRNGDIGELQHLFGYSYPVSGRLDFDVNTDGLRDNQHGHGHLRLRDAVVYDQPVSSADSDVRFERLKAVFSNGSIRVDGGSIEGDGAYDFDTSAFQFRLNGNDLHLEHFVKFNSPKFRATGLLGFTASGSGTPEHPSIDAAAHLLNFTVNSQKFGGLDLEAVTRERVLKLKANSRFQNASVNLEGEIQMEGDFPARAQLSVSSSDLNPLLAAFMPARATGPTVISGRANVSGPLRSPSNLTVDVVLDRLEGELEKVTIQNQGPIHLRMADRVISVDQLRFGGESSRFFEMRGTAEVGGQKRLALSANGSVNLKLLQTLYPALMSSGSATLDVAVAGTLQHPAIDGEIRVQNAGFNYIDLPNGLSEVNGTLAFNRNRLQVQKLTARTGGGLVDLGGFITYDRGIAFNLTASGRDIRIRYPAGVSSTADADLVFAGNLKSATLSGDITITRFGLNQDFDFASYLARGKEPPVVPNSDSPLNNVHLDVHVLSTPELQVQTSLAKVAGTVDLHMRGTGTRPSLLGRVNITEGELSFNGARYRLERGDISFSNPVRIEPVLNLEATATVRDYDITLEFHGPMDKLKTNYRSDPPLPTGDIVALLALGRTRNEAENAATTPGSQQQPPTVTESASNALLGQALNATVSSRMQKLFGVSRIKIDPQVGGPENSANARVTIEQQVSNKVTLTYISNLTQSAQQVIQFEYNVNRNVSILAVRDQNGIVGVEVRVRQRKK
jgi:translocation and assembly module TamB